VGPQGPGRQVELAWRWEIVGAGVFAARVHAVLAGLGRGEARERLGLRQGDKALLLFGQIAPYKGLNYLVGALAELATESRDFKLIVAGRVKPGHSNYWDRIKSEIARARLMEFVIQHVRFIPDDEVEVYLMSLPGVGPKTAAVVLAFSLGRPALPVDTHVHRVVGRLGWIGPGAGAAAAHEMLKRIVPPRLRVPMHVGLIRLGREICKPGRPRCEECPLNDLCPTAPRYLGAGATGTQPSGKRTRRAP